MGKLFSLILLFTSIRVMAFPEMIRHHYTNCSACHVSQSGGGLLNPYGRTISAEVLSSRSAKNEERPFYIADTEKVSERLNVGGELRTLQIHQESSQTRSGRTIWMEANLQAAIQKNNLTVLASLGTIDQGNQSYKAELGKYFAAYQMTDEVSIRAGKFIPIFGLNIPQHNFYIRKILSLGAATERMAADIQYNGELWNFLIGFSKSSKTSAVGEEENSLNIQIQRTLMDQYKLGGSFWSGESETYRRLGFSGHVVLGWREDLYTLTEINYVLRKDNKDQELKTISELFKSGYEISKGIHLQVIQEWQSSDTNNINSGAVGVIWYPRPHFEFEGVYGKKMSDAGGAGLEDFLYMMAHYYF